MNSRPRDDAAQARLRVPEHGANGLAGFRQRNSSRAASRLAVRKQHQQRAAMTRAATPIADQNVVHGVPRRNDRPDDKLPGRTAGHAEHLCRADQSRGFGGGKVIGRDVDGADESEHAAGALEEASDARDSRIARRKHQCADTDRGRADRDDLPRAEPIQRRAGDQPERRVALVEQAHQRRHRRRAHAERFRELRHHHRGRRSQRVLIEVVHRRDQPRDDGSRCSRRSRSILDRLTAI